MLLLLLSAAPLLHCLNCKSLGNSHCAKRYWSGVMQRGGSDITNNSILHEPVSASNVRLSCCACFAVNYVVRSKALPGYGKDFRH